MRWRDAKGQTSIEYAAVLVLIGVIGAALIGTGFGPSVAQATEHAVCRILGNDCGDDADPQTFHHSDGGGTDEPPAPIDFDLPFPVLPFPGSVSVSCSYSATSPGTCQPGEGVSVGAEGSLEFERSEVTLDAEGCPTETLSVTGRLELQAGASGETPTVSGGLQAILGEATTYSITAPAGVADDIASGERDAPNPVDPRTIQAGGSVELAHEFYTGHNLEASYRALELELGYDEGRRVSAGVSRVDPSTVRIHVGDEEFVRNALSLGIGNDTAGIAMAAGGESSDGKLRTVDVDISTAEGWKTYQRFLTTGKLPDEGTPGTSDPTDSKVFKITDKTQLEGHLGNVTIGGILAESGATATETRLADGTVENSFTGHYNDAGVTVITRQEPGGEPEPVRYSLMFENVDDDTIEMYEHVTGRPLARGNDGNVRFDFTPDDLMAIKEQAFEQLMGYAEDTHQDIDEETMREIIESGDPDQYGINIPMTNTLDFASAETPEQVLLQLYTGSGVGRDGDVGLQSLVDFMQRTVTARYDIRDTVEEHPDTLLPGTPVEPDCP